MTWVLYGLLTAVFRSLTDVSSKIGLKNLNEYVVAWSLNFFSLPLLYLTLPFIDIPKIGPNFWIALLFGGGGNLLTAMFYMKAIRHSDLSIKRSSVIISVLLGALIFKEKGLKERLAGTILMILGVLLITLF